MRFIQIRKLPLALKETIGKVFQKKEASQGALTPFQAVCTALAATVGTGNIAGVAGVLLGGIKRIGRVNERLVPFMAHLIRQQLLVVLWEAFL